MNCFFDTNIWIRYFVGNDTAKAALCKKLLTDIENGKIRPYLSSIVLLEVYWVLTSVYKFPKQKVIAAIEIVLSIRGLVIVETSEFRRAFSLHQKTGVKLADCLIATQVGKGITLVTYDREFRKIPRLAVAEPAEVLKTLSQ